MKERNLLSSIFVFGLLSTLLAGSGRLFARAEGYPTRPSADFDRDLYADLAIGVPFNDLTGVSDAGAVNVLYGSSSGLSLTGVQLWHQAVFGTEDEAEAGEHFGHALAVGDFDGDGRTDLAVGVPRQTVSGQDNAGAVHIFYGYSTGLSTLGDEVWHQDTGIVGSISEEDDGFGSTLAAGDFDADGFDDLAVGVPYENWDADNGGIVQVLYGSSDGLTDVGHMLFRQGADGLQEEEELGDSFGEALAVGDFNADGHDDLVIGVPHENFENPSPLRYDVGVVHVLYGTDAGLSSDDQDLWYQDRSYMEDESHNYDYFGWALTAGDFDGEGHDDLVVGVSGEAAGEDVWAGAVHILYGGPNGLTAVLDVLLNEDDLGVSAGAYDGFGKALAAGDFDGDGRDDLAVGAPDRPFIGITPDNVGAVYVLYGSDTGPSTTRRLFWYQGDLFNLADVPEENDQFGYSLATGDFDRSGYCDLVIGVPYEDITYGTETKVDAGAVHVLYGTANGLGDAGDNDLWLVQANSAIPDAPNNYEVFGYSLAAVPDVFQRVHLPLVVKTD
jgi:hypothetical protein